jgi:uncharacterized protein
MLRYNVAGLMKSAPGEYRVYAISNETMDVADDLPLSAPIEGQLRLSRTSRSVLAHADLQTEFVLHCSRCVATINAPVAVVVDEEALPSVDFETGLPLDISDEPDALRLDEHHELDLHETIREAISLAEPIAPLCREDCRGLCVTCGSDLNADPGHHHDDEAIDPRLAALAAWKATSDTAGPPDRTH